MGTQEVPPPEHGRATLANWRQTPFSHWAFHHVREIVPTAAIAHDPKDIWALPQGELDLSQADLGSAINGIATDALIILHQGRVVHETYRNGMTAADPHIVFSASKSILGLVAGVLEARGVLDVAAPVTEYLPELADTAYAGATIRQALDMQVAALFEQDDSVTENAADLRAYQFLLNANDGLHGQRFHYVSPVADMLGWALERASGARYADLLSDWILKPMGAEQPGYITLDLVGGARAGGGICLTARDFARLGQLVLQGGARGARQVVPEAWIADIRSGGDRGAWRRGDLAAQFPGADMSYRSLWYVVHGEAPLLRALGIHGQFLFVDPLRELVVAWLSSENAPTDPAWGNHVMRSVDRIRAAVD